MEVLTEHGDKISSSKILDELKLKAKEYFLVSVHRQENVDFPERLKTLLNSLTKVSEVFEMPVIISTHPRTRKKLLELSDQKKTNLVFHEPFGFLDYNHLQSRARMVLSDSGTISEESAMLGFPAVTLRDSMERPEALEAGTIVMSGIEPDRVIEAINLVESGGLASITPSEYRIPDTSTRVVNFLISTVHQYNFWNGIRKLD